MPQGATPLADATHPLEPHLKDGRIVKLNGKGWEEIPADVVSPLLCAEAKEVDLSKNKLSKVPDEFFSSIRLAEGLHLQFNRLSQLPLGLCGLQSLKLLQLFNNQLSDLPDQLSELSSLIDIRIGFNRFTQLPKVCPLPCPLPPVPCPLSPVPCPLSPVPCRLSPVPCPPQLILTCPLRCCTRCRP